MADDWLLYTTEAGWGLPSLEPASIQAQAYLHLAGVPLSVQACSLARSAPTGKRHGERMEMDRSGFARHLSRSRARARCPRSPRVPGRCRGAGWRKSEPKAREDVGRVRTLSSTPLSLGGGSGGRRSGAWAADSEGSEDRR